MLKKISTRKMPAITVLAILAFLILLTILIILIRYNWSNKILAQIISISLVGLGTIITTILLNLKETKLQDHFITTIILDNEKFDVPHPKGGEETGILNPNYYKRVEHINSIQGIVSSENLLTELAKIQGNAGEIGLKRSKLINGHAMDAVTFALFKEIVALNTIYQLNDQSLALAIEIPDTFSIKKLNFNDYHFS